MTDVSDDNIADELKGEEKKEFKKLSKELDKDMGFKVKENLEIDSNITRQNNYHLFIANEIEKGFTDGEIHGEDGEPIKWELEVSVKDWVKLDDEDIDMIATQIREGETKGNDPIDWSLDFGGDNFEEEEEIIDDNMTEDQKAVVVVLVSKYGYGLENAKNLVYKHSDIIDLYEADAEEGASHVVDHEEQGYDEVEEYEECNIKRYESFSRKELANQMDLDEEDFEDSSSLGDMVDNFNDELDSYEYVKDETEDLFNAFKEDNDVSKYFTDTIGNDFEYNKVASLYKDVSDYYSTYERKYGYLEEFNSPMFNSTLKELIRNFLNR